MAKSPNSRARAAAPARNAAKAGEKPSLFGLAAAAPMFDRCAAGNSTNRAFGIADAHSRAAAGVGAESKLPAMTSVGATMRASAAR